MNVPLFEKQSTMDVPLLEKQSSYGRALEHWECSGTKVFKNGHIVCRLY